MNICLVSSLYPPEVIGGAERHVHTLAEHLVQKGHSVSVITSRHSSHKHYQEINQRNEAGITVYRFTPLNIHSRIEYPEVPTWKKPIVHGIDLWNPHCYFMIRRILAQINPDLIHIHTYKGLSNAVFRAAADEKVPVLHTLHDYTLLHVRGDLYKSGTIIEPGVLLYPYQRFNQITIESHVNRILAPSQFAIDKHHSEGLLKTVPCTWLPLGVKRRSSEEISKIRSQIAADKFRVLYTGQLHARKGVDLLIEAVKHLTITEIQVDILGKGPDSRALRQLGSNDDRIHFHGFVSEKELEEFYMSADLTVIPSRWYENSPLVIYESYAHGTPVLAADIGGIPELVDEGITGYLFEPNNTQSLSNRLQQVYSHGTKEMSEAAWQKSQQFTLKSHINNLIDIYKEEMNDYFNL